MAHNYVNLCGTQPIPKLSRKTRENPGFAYVCVFVHLWLYYTRGCVSVLSALDAKYWQVTQQESNKLTHIQCKNWEVSKLQQAHVKTSTFSDFNLFV